MKQRLILKMNLLVFSYIHIHSEQLVFSQMFAAGRGVGNCLNMLVCQTTCIDMHVVTRITTIVMLNIVGGKKKRKYNATKPVIFNI